MADILLAYEDYSHMFSDETGIPESGNGIPDILDEDRYEFRMDVEDAGQEVWRSLS